MSASAPSRSDQTRARIVEAALKLFRERGFAQTTMREIAAEAGVALGATYYYFASKDELVMAFYHAAAEQKQALIEEALAGKKTLESRVLAILEVNFRYFAPNRKFLGALLGHAADPENPLSPFSENTRPIREHDMQHFAAAIAGGEVKPPADLAPYLPQLLWLYQMGLILFWLHDRSPEQSRTRLLAEQSLKVVVALIRLSRLPLFRPVRRRVVDLLGIVQD